MAASGRNIHGASGESKGWFPLAQTQTQPTKLQRFGSWLRETFLLSDTRQDTFRFAFDDLSNLPSFNYEQGDYEKLHQLYFGDAASGIQLGGLFAQPIVKFYTAFLIGQLPKVVIRDRRTAGKEGGGTNGKELQEFSLFANQFLQDQHGNLIDLAQSQLLYGDTYVAFGLDRNLEAIPPYPQKVIPGFNMFSPGLRTFTVGVTRSLRDMKNPDTKGDVSVVRTFTPTDITYEATTDSQLNLNQFGQTKISVPHLLGTCPVLHVPNNPLGGQQFGWCEFIQCLPYMNIFHHVLVRGFEAQQYAGKPILAVTGIEGTVKAWLKRTFDIDVTTDSSDAVQEKMKSFFQKFKFFAFAGEVDAKYLENKYPIGATGELLDIAFRSIVKTSMIPEFMFGVAIESANASVREQYVSLKTHIRRKRIEFGRHLATLIKWALYFYSSKSTNPDTGEEYVTYGFVSDPKRLQDLHVELIWPQILNSDEQLKLDSLRLLMDLGGLSFEGAYENLQELIPDGVAELERVRKEFNDDTLPAKGKASGKRNESNRDEPTNTRNQRTRDDQGTGGNSSGRTGSGRGQ